MLQEESLGEEFYHSIHQTILDCGQQVIGVCGNHGGPPYAYTIGNHFAQRPELLVMGLGGEAGQWLLNEVAARMNAQGKPFEHGTILHFGGEFGVKIIDASDFVKEEYTVQAGQFFSTEDYRVQQVVIPDKAGKFPGEEGCAEPYASFPVFARH